MPATNSIRKEVFRKGFTFRIKLCLSKRKGNFGPVRIKICLNKKWSFLKSGTYFAKSPLSNSMSLDVNEP